MANNAVFLQIVLLLLATLGPGFHSSAENPAPSANRAVSKGPSITPDKSSGNPSPLQGKPLVVRLYGGDATPSAFRRIEVMIHHEDGCAGDVQSVAKGQMPHFLFDAKGIPEDSVLLIVTEDQTDPTAKEYLGNGIQSPLVQKGRCYFCLNQHGRKVLVADALGAPIADAVLELRFNVAFRKKTFAVRYGSWRTDTGGYAELPEVGAFVLVAEAFVAQPAYGTACVKNPDYKSRIDTPLVAQGTEARERALRGRVVDADDRPVEAAIVSVDSVTPASGVSTLLHPSAVVLTDAKGCFALLAVNSQLPAHSLFQYKVAPPTSAASVKCNGEATNDAETVIRLERGTFHTFIFKDESGQILDKSKVCCFSVIRKDTRFNIDQDEVRSGAVLADGTYFANMDYMTEEKGSTGPGDKSQYSTSEPITFPNIEVTSSSPKELVFRLRDLVFRGEVLHAKTQAPLEGILVTTGGLPSKALRPDEQQWLGSFVSDTISGTVRDFIFTRTGKDGHFELTLKPGQKTDKLGLWARDFLPYKYPTRNREPDADGILDLEKIPMFPAGTLSFQINSENTDEQYAAIWKIEESAPSLCALPHWDRLLAGLMDPRSYFLDSNWHRVNRLEHLQIPAEMAVSVEVRSVLESSRGFVLPHLFTLAQGEVSTLAAVTLQAPIKVPVQIVDEYGNPYEGICVRSTSGGLPQAPVYTGTKGMAVIPMAPDSSGTLSIAKEPRGRTDPVVVACPFSLHGNVPEKSPYVLVLPIEDAPQVFESMPKSDSPQQPRLRLRGLDDWLFPRRRFQGGT